ncbi:peptidoglycan-binding protein LysM [Actinomyces sp. Z5]|uniref:peptidoglycan-binding protein LysM n=1 Tax=Actinomyces sp. Z5 TaxID=2250216 RepID=UPI00215BCBCE|nr:peptidoglycan-binding protein LysM [Actinomyces sp. Z5]
MSASTWILTPDPVARRRAALGSARLACLGLACAAAMPVLLGTAAQSVRSLLALPPAWWGASQLSAAITALACGAGAVGALWHLVSVVVALVVLRRSTRAGTLAGFRNHDAGAAVRLLRRWGAPLVRRIAGGVLVVGITTSPALAATDSAPDTDDLGWQPTVNAPAQPGTPEAIEPEALASPAATAPAVPTPTAEATAHVPLLPDADNPGAQLTDPLTTRSHSAGAVAGGSPTTIGEPTVAASHRVAVGESLWSITASLLGPEAATADIAAAWPHLYQANVETIGTDPGLIHPGTLLTVPALTDPSDS